jgi:hypothetical protein
LFHQHLNMKVKTLQLWKNQWQRRSWTSLCFSSIFKNLAHSASPLSLDNIGARQYSIKVWWRKPGLFKRAVIRDQTKVWSFFLATIWTT